MSVDDDSIERGLKDVLGPDANLLPSDADLLSRLIDGALEQTTPPPARTGPKLALVAGGGLLIMAVILGLRHRDVPTPITAPPQASIAAPSIASSVPEIEVKDTPVVVAPIVSAPPVRELSAAELFTRANEARRKGKDANAIEDYRTLQRKFPGSVEANASRVALGRLLLDKHKDAKGALEQFDAYLATQDTGTLREEALIGRALALQSLGRGEEERRAWQRLLDSYPQSIYAERARERISALSR